MTKVYLSKKLRKLPKKGKIRTQNEVDRHEHNLNVLMVVITVLILAFFIVLEVRHCIALDEAALNMTQQEWNAAGGAYWWTE